MSIVTDEPQPLAPPEQHAPPEDNLQSRVLGLLDVLYPRGTPVERRAQRRYPYPYLLQLTPVADDGTAQWSETVVVVGKHLSQRGLGFYHPWPLPYRRMIASLETTGGGRLDLLINLTWCRFTREGWYESGGRFLQAVPPPRMSA